MNNSHENKTGPSPAQINHLVSLYNARRFQEMEQHAHRMVGQFPTFGFAWKLLGAAQQMQGKNALAAFQKTAELMPEDAEAHFNLGVVQKALGKLKDAEASYRHALKKNPAMLTAQANLGNVLRELGQLDEAISCFRRVLKIKPDIPEAHNNLGTALKDLGQLEEAQDSYRRAISLKPDFADAHYNLGNTLKMQGKLGEAAMCYHKAVELRPDLVDAHFSLGCVLRDSGQPEAAAACYSRVTELKPDYADAYFNLGNMLFDSGQLVPAVNSYSRATVLNPDSVSAHNNLGAALRELGQFENAVASFRKALELEPDSANILGDLGLAYIDLLKYVEAQDCFSRVLQIDPGNIGARLGMAHLHTSRGEIDKAEETYHEALKTDPDNLSVRFHLANMRKTQPGDSNFAALMAMYNDAVKKQISMPVKKALSLNFVLGKCLAELGEYEQAFPHFIEGCRLKRSTLKYDPAETSAQFREVARVFSSETIERLRNFGNSSATPIFVLGMPRSGTTLTEQIIASHPDVFGAGELPDMLRIAHRKTGNAKSFPENIAQLGQTAITNWAEDYLAGLRQYAPDSPRITDKMPENFWALGLIHVMLPNAKVIHVKRNPVDTCISCFTILFNSGLEYSYNLSELGQYYAGYARLMEHWRNVLPAGSFLDVAYEDIVTEQEVQSRRIIEFCELDWNDACVDFHKHERSVSTASVTQVRQPIYKTSMERWRPYEKYLDPLFEALGEFAPKRD